MAYEDIVREIGRISNLEEKIRCVEHILTYLLVNRAEPTISDKVDNLLTTFSRDSSSNADFL
jgi:hypothetical protein